jgi:hypothetical protein
MNSALKTLRVVQWAMLASILIYVILSVVIPTRLQMLDPAVSYLFTTLGVAVVGAIFVVRRTLVFRAEESLARSADDKLALNQWRTGYIATYALCEALALFGLTERFLGSDVRQSVPYYIGGFVLMFFFRPRAPETSASGGTSV